MSCEIQGLLVLVGGAIGLWLLENTALEELPLLYLSKGVRP